MVERLRPAFYVRYVDDLILFATNKNDLHWMRTEIDEGLRDVRLRMHLGKSRIYSSAEGITFLGWRLFPNRLRLERGNVARFDDRMKQIRRDFGAGQVSWPVVSARIQAWIGHAAYGATWVLRERMFDRCAFGAGVWP